MLVPQLEVPTHCDLARLENWVPHALQGATPPGEAALAGHNSHAVLAVLGCQPG